MIVKSGMFAEMVEKLEPDIYHKILAEELEKIELQYKLDLLKRCTDMDSVIE
jgi:hypothetical protein